MTRTNSTLRALAMAALLMAGCGDGNNNGGDGGNVDDGGTDATGPYTGPLWVATGWTTSGDEYFGYLSVVRDLTSGAVDLGSVIDLGQDYSFGTDNEGNVYVGYQHSPVIRKWSLNDEGVLEVAGTLNLSARDVTSCMGGNRNVIQIISPTRAYYLDNQNYEAHVFNPTTMLFTADPVIDLGELIDVPNVDSYALNFVARANGNLYVSARYWDAAEYPIQETRVAVLNETTGAVTFDTDDRCGDIAFVAQDTNGDVYFGTHHALAAFGGDPMDATPPAPCMLRILAGQTSFDPAYQVNLNTLVGGIGAGLFQGPDGHAFIAKYEGSVGPMGEPNAPFNAPNWRMYSIELGNEAATLTVVPELPLVARYVGFFDAQIGGSTVPFLITETGEGGSYTNLSNLTDPTPALSVVGGSLGRAAQLRD